MKKNDRSTEFGTNGHKLGQNVFLCHFLEFGSYVFFEIAYDDSPRQCLTSSGRKTHEKSLGVQIWVTWAKIGAEISFFGHFLRFGLLVFFFIFQTIATNCGPNKGLTGFLKLVFLGIFSGLVY